MHKGKTILHGTLLLTCCLTKIPIFSQNVTLFLFFFWSLLLCFADLAWSVGHTAQYCAHSLQWFCCVWPVSVNVQDMCKKKI